MKIFIFVTDEWATFQPYSSSIEPDIENLQVIWFWKWNDSHEAFDNLLKNNEYIKWTTFSEIWCYELASKEIKWVFYLDWEE